MKAFFGGKKVGDVIIWHKLNNCSSIVLFMGYQSRKKSPKGAIHQYRKNLREKRKNKKNVQGQVGRPVEMEERPTATEREISEVTLTRLHTLGSQKFGSSPYSEHFDRWLTNVTVVIAEFESNPNVGIDDQFEQECSRTINAVKQQLESIRRRETAADQEEKKLFDARNRLKLFNAEYAIKSKEIRNRKTSQTRRLIKCIKDLKKEQDRIIRLKTGFFHRTSKKKSERLEMEVTQELNDKQSELELCMMNFKAALVELEHEFSKKKEPIFEDIKSFKKTIENTETDGSLEERWIACEALADSMNAYRERKAAQQK
jgi:hypothetical protein